MDQEPVINRAKKKITISFEHCGHVFVFDWNDRNDLSFGEILDTVCGELARHGDEIIKVDKEVLAEALLIFYSK